MALPGHTLSVRLTISAPYSCQLQIQQSIASSRAQRGDAPLQGPPPPPRGARHFNQRPATGWGDRFTSWSGFGALLDPDLSTLEQQCAGREAGSLAGPNPSSGTGSSSSGAAQAGQPGKRPGFLKRLRRALGSSSRAAAAGERDDETQQLVESLGALARRVAEAAVPETINLGWLCLVGGRVDPREEAGGASSGSASPSPAPGEGMRARMNPADIPGLPAMTKAAIRQLHSPAEAAAVEGLRREGLPPEGVTAQDLCVVVAAMTRRYSALSKRAGRAPKPQKRASRHPVEPWAHLPLDELGALLEGTLQSSRDAIYHRVTIKLAAWMVRTESNPYAISLVIPPTHPSHASCSILSGACPAQRTRCSRSSGAPSTRTTAPGPAAPRTASSAIAPPATDVAETARASKLAGPSPRSTRARRTLPRASLRRPRYGT